MAIRIGELPDSRSGNGTSEERKYWVMGTSDRATIEATVLSYAPAVVVTYISTLFRDNRGIGVRFSSNNYCVVTVPYSETDTSGQEGGSFAWSFDSTGGTVNIKCALSHVASYPAGAPNHQGAIGWDGTEVQGADIVIPAGKFSVQFTHPRGVLNMQKAKAIMRNTGKVNSDTFLTYAAGEVLFLGGRGSDGSNAPAEVNYDFAVSENLQNQVIGGITVAEKQGWDVAWIQFKEDLDSTKPIRPPQWIHVDRVYRRMGMSSFFGFG